MTKYQITTFHGFNMFSRVADHDILVIGAEHVRNHLAHLPAEVQDIILEEAEGNGTSFLNAKGERCHIREVLDYSKVSQPTAAEEDAAFEARRMQVEEREERQAFPDYPPGELPAICNLSGSGPRNHRVRLARAAPARLARHDWSPAH